MKNVVKISISGLAFTLEEEGYALLERYLLRLKKYYSRQQNGMEVVEGIEERIAELLRERMSASEEVVSKELIQEVMDIMGSPEDIEGEGAEEPKPKRRLYRNVDDRILGGVCSGLAAYFNLEPLLFRVIFVVLAFFSSFGMGFLRFSFPHHFGFSIGGWTVLAYIILWIVIPSAKTVAQRCEMRGERPDFSGIQDRVKRGAEQFEREVRRGAERVGSSDIGKGIGRIITFCVGIVLLLIAVPVLIALPISLVFSASWIYGLLPKGLSSIVAFHGNFLWVHILGALALLLPFVGMLFAGISLIFNLKRQRVRPGLFIFIIWLLSIFALVVVIAIGFRPYYGGVEEAHKEVPIVLQSDTLYVHYTSSGSNSHFLEVPEKNLWMNAGASEAALFWFEGERKSLRAVVYPHIRIIRVDSSHSMRAEFIGNAAGYYIDEAIERAEEALPAYKLQDSLLSLLPAIYSRSRLWQGDWGEILIYLPRGKEVVMTSPYWHHFDRSSSQITKGRMIRGLHFGPYHQSEWSNRRERDRGRWDNRRDRWDNRLDRMERRWNRWERRFSR